MSNELKGKVALITGSTRGIGLATAKQLAEFGAKVIIHGRSECVAKQVATTIKGAIGIGSDLRFIGQVYGLCTRLSDIDIYPDILINNAAMAFAINQVKEINDNIWKDTIQVNLTSAFIMSQQTFHEMNRRGWGRIVNVSSIAAHSFSQYCNVAYSVSKAGLVTMTKQLAWEWGRYGIAVNCVCPGQTNTDMLDPNRKYMDRIVKAIPDGRIATPDEIAKVIAWLCLPSTTHINGAVIDVSGGAI